MPLDQKDNLVFQSYCTTTFLMEMSECGFVPSEGYNKLNFQDKSFQKHFGTTVPLLNNGTFLIFFYTLLVVPKEILFEEYKNEFFEIGKWVKENAVMINHEVNGVKSDLKIEWIIPKIRNSISHASVVFNNDNTVCFLDELEKSSYKTSITIPLSLINEFIKRLQSLFLKYINSPRIRA